MFIMAVAVTSAIAQNGSPQSEVASSKAMFGVVTAEDASVAKAIIATDLRSAASMQDKQGAFKGIVAKVFAPNSGTIVILNFDKNYKNALTAVLRKANFSKFPDLQSLDGKMILVTGKFVNYKGAMQIELTDPAQIKIID
jgi:DNA/RNA endonuclease YhcR with UshA esterase domain